MILFFLILIFLLAKKLVFPYDKDSYTTDGSGMDHMEYNSEIADRLGMIRLGTIGFFSHLILATIVIRGGPNERIRIKVWL